MLARLLITASLALLALPAVANAAAVTVDGTAGDDTLVVTASGSDSGTWTLNGVDHAFSGATSFTWNGGNGDDLVQIK
ncbi:MAG: hypothetical protein QOJ12_2774, partial [Thermoleophilales bacterium]|nr:hypothetical protein [Thermoleophilales bacterium]